jgi:predicted alpha-1,2-mannosidase
MMTIRNWYFVLIACSIVVLARANEPNLADFVNPLMGTDSEYGFSNGNTYPVIALPWGMNFWTPQTGKMGDGWIYTYQAKKIVGFRQTHQPSPWINDYGQFSIMPITGKPVFPEEERASWFSHKAEIVHPYYYSVYLADHDVRAEMAPTERAAIFRFQFPDTDSAYVVIDAFDEGSFIKVIPEESKIIGYTSRNSGGVPENFKNFFVITFSHPMHKSMIWSNSGFVSEVQESESEHAGAVIQFSAEDSRKIVVRVASSFISFEQAEINLLELQDDNFEEVKAKARDRWNKELGRIQVQGGTCDQVRTFYSCLYRTMLFPRKFYEIDGSGEIVHYSPYNGKVLHGYMFTDNGFWDTFRAAFPLLNLVFPSLSAQVQEGLINTYRESGWLPEWASPGHRDCMIGSNSASIVADAWLKGVGEYDINQLYEAALKNTREEGPLSSVGRKGAYYYNSLGYVPCDVGIRENAARTLEYAYDDFALFLLAKALGRPKSEVQIFADHCQNYKNIFDADWNLMRGRKSNGDFQTPFNPFKWGDAFTEGNSLHYTWSVFHDIQGLINAMEGPERFIAMLDTVFDLPPVFDDSYYGSTIHEIREMQTIGMGNYAHGNQPIQHMIYLYNYAGQPWKSQFWVREVMDKLYQPTPDGYCGDEDNGQTSAWYVFSAMGFYPVCPVSDQYVLGSPLFQKIVLNLENGNKVEINASGNSMNTPYIEELTLNGKSWENNWIAYEDLINGGEISFTMSDIPNRNRGDQLQNFPYSFSLHQKPD